MNDAIGAFGTDDRLVLRLLAQLAHPALPAAGWASACLLIALSAVWSGQGQHDQCEHEAHPQAIKAAHIPLQPLLQALHNFVPCASHVLPLPTACLSATMKSGSKSRPQVMLEVERASKRELAKRSYQKGGEQ
jgi:hypothetical protein